MTPAPHARVSVERLADHATGIELQLIDLAQSGSPDAETFTALVDELGSTSDRIAALCSG